MSMAAAQIFTLYLHLPPINLHNINDVLMIVQAARHH